MANNNSFVFSAGIFFSSYYEKVELLKLSVGETGLHWDKNQSSESGPNNVNLTTSDIWFWKSLTCCPWYVSTGILLCKRGWCESLLKNASQLSNCAPYLGHIGTRDGAHWDYILVKENKCKLRGKYIFVNKVQTKNMRQPACQNNNLDVKCPNRLSIWCWHWENVPLYLKTFVPPAPEKAIREKCEQKIMRWLRILHMTMST